MQEQVGSRVGILGRTGLLRRKQHRKEKERTHGEEAFEDFRGRDIVPFVP